MLLQLRCKVVCGVDFDLRKVEGGCDIIQEALQALAVVSCQEVVDQVWRGELLHSDLVLVAVERMLADLPRVYLATQDILCLTPDDPMIQYMTYLVLFIQGVPTPARVWSGLMAAAAPSLVAMHTSLTDFGETRIEKEVREGWGYAAGCL